MKNNRKSEKQKQYLLGIVGLIILMGIFGYVFYQKKPPAVVEEVPKSTPGVSKDMYAIQGYKINPIANFKTSYGMHQSNCILGTTLKGRLENGYVNVSICGPFNDRTVEQLISENLDHQTVLARTSITAHNHPALQVFTQVIPGNVTTYKSI